jgi:hypothetical protein
MALPAVVAGIRDLLPHHLRSGWDAIQGGFNRWCEPQADRTALWITTHGPRHGFRPPTTAERSAALGLDEYLPRLGLSEVEVYNLQGNSFDTEALRMRACGPLRAIANGDIVSGHTFPTPSRILGMYASVRAHVEQLGLGAVSSPFPADLHDILALVDAGATLAALLQQSAAQVGRGRE